MESDLTRIVNKINKKLLREEVNLLNHKGEDNLSYLKDMIMMSLQHPKNNRGSKIQSKMLINLINMFKQMYEYLDEVQPEMVNEYSFHNIDNWVDLGNGEPEKGYIFLNLLKGLLIDYNLLGDEWGGFKPDRTLEGSDEVHNLVIDLADIITKK